MVLGWVVLRTSDEAYLSLMSVVVKNDIVTSLLFVDLSPVFASKLCEI